MIGLTRAYFDIESGVSDDGHGWIAVIQPDTQYSYIHMMMKDGVIHYTSITKGLATYYSISEMIKDRKALLLKQGEVFKYGNRNLPKGQYAVLVGQSAPVE